MSADGLHVDQFNDIPNTINEDNRFSLFALIASCRTIKGENSAYWAISTARSVGKVV